MRFQTQIMLASFCLLCTGIANAQTGDLTTAKFTNTSAIRPTLTAFSGSEKNNVVSLIWSTNGEKNSSHFIIERSADGLQFDSIGAVTAVGRFQLPTSYNFEDLQPNTRNNYYRVRIADLNGSVDSGKIFKIESAKFPSRKTSVARLSAR